MRHLILIPLALASLAEYLSQGQFGLALVSALYMTLTLQAESSAKRFLRDGLQPVSTLAETGFRPTPRKKISIEDVLDVKPLGEKKSGYSHHEQEPKRERPKAKPHPQPAAKPAPSKPAPKRELPKAPQFYGKPHEVLAVSENAATQTIVRAFRHWVKQYHPDHAHNPAQVESANEHTRCLTDAKEKLLQRRKQMRKPSVA